MDDDFDSFFEEKTDRQIKTRETLKISKIMSHIDDPDYKASNFIQKIVTDNIKDVYSFKKKIGAGNFGTVRLASPKTNPEKIFAVKTIPRERIEDDLELLEQELQILLTVDHPNIIQFYETYRDQKYFHIVMEYCDGGELFEKLMAIGRFPEQDTAKIIK